jgi:hypothetical protein
LALVKVKTFWLHHNMADGIMVGMCVRGRDHTVKHKEEGEKKQQKFFDNSFLWELI